MSKKYSKEEIKKIWDKIKPTEEEIEDVQNTRTKTEIMEIKQILSTKHKFEIFPAIDILNKQLSILQDRVERLESAVGTKEPISEEGIELRMIPEKEAVELIKSYVDNHQGCLTSDIVFDLRLNPDLVLKALRILEKKERVRGDRVES